MKFFVVVFFVLTALCCDSKAQTTDKLPLTPILGFYGANTVSKDICFITVKIRPSESGKNHNWEHYYINQKVNFGYRFAQLFGYAKSKRWSFESGFVITKKIMDVDFESYIPQVNVKNSTTNPIYYKTTYHCLDIPLRVLFTEGQKKLKFLCSFGINKTFSLSLNRDAQTFSGNEIIAQQRDLETKGVKKIFSSSDWGAGLRYDLSPFSQLRLLASVQRSYASIKSDNKKVLFWNAGMCLGYCYFFK